MNLDLIHKYLDEIKEMNLANRAEKALSHKNFQALQSLEYKLEGHREVLTHYEKKLEGLDGFMRDMAKVIQQKNINQALAHIPLKASEVKQFMKGVRKEFAQYNKEQKQKKKQESKNSWRTNNMNKLKQLLSLKNRLQAQGRDTSHLDPEIQIRQKYTGPADSNNREERKAGKKLHKELRSLPKGTQDIDLLEKREGRNAPQELSKEYKDWLDQVHQNQKRIKQQSTPSPKALDHLSPLLQKKKRKQTHTLEEEV